MRGLPPAPLALAATQHGLFSRAQAAEHGVTPYMVRYRLETGEVEVLGRRVLRIGGSSRSFEQRCMAGVLDTGRGAVVSGRAAAVLWGLPGNREGPIEILQIADIRTDSRLR